MEAFKITNILHEPNGYKRLQVAPIDPEEPDEPDKVVDYQTFERCRFAVGRFYILWDDGQIGCSDEAPEVITEVGDARDSGSGTGNKKTAKKTVRTKKASKKS